MNYYNSWNISWRIIVLLLIAWTLRSCANRGQGPQGGPKDTTPPKVMKETPLNGTVNYRSKQIEVEFDELVLVQKLMDNVVISPPQLKLPDIKTRGKKLQVVFNEPLKDSTTYTIQFGNAIVDNNEKNPLPNYTFSFSTGDVIDSLQIAGHVLDAENLNPVLGAFAGIHTAEADSLFTKQPFLRVSKTDSAGGFVIKNVREGRYATFALSDNSRDYIYQSGEGLAFNDSVIIPRVHNTWRMDTVWMDSVTIDTIQRVLIPHYSPDDVVLFHFKDNKAFRQFTKYDRSEQHFFRLFFSAPSDSVPVIKPMDVDWTAAMVMQSNPTNDTITCWLTDSLVIAMDSLKFILTYQKSDSLFNLYAQTDTMQVVYRKPRGGKKPQTDTQETFLKLTHNATETFEVYDDLKIYSPTPIQHRVDSMLHFYVMKDSVPIPLTMELTPCDDSNMRFAVAYDWTPDTHYRLVMDSAAWMDIYGKTIAPTTLKWKIRPVEDYANLVIQIAPYDSLAVLQLLSTKDEVVRQLPAQPEGTKFENVRPGDYFLRLFVDANQDGKWTTGDYSQKRQPEKVVYSPKKITLRANWDMEELWNTEEVPLLNQKPKELQKLGGMKKK